MDIIYCAVSGKRLVDIAIEEGFLYGARSDEIRRGVHCNGMIDINWTNYDWNNHLEQTEIHFPKYAVVPDILKHRELPRILRLASIIEPHCTRVIVVPKNHGLIKYIPERYVIGISVPTSYAGFIPPVVGLRGRDLHLLGGSPVQQRELWRYYRSMGIRVVSLDINCHSKASDYGSYWDGYKWNDTERRTIGKYEAFRKSCRGIVGMWIRLGAISS